MCKPAVPPYKMFVHMISHHAHDDLPFSKVLPMH